MVEYDIRATEQLGTAEDLRRADALYLINSVRRRVRLELVE